VKSVANILYVGDPHATVAELPDMEALVGLIGRVVEREAVDGIVFLGDQYHHHGILHLEVIDFWMRTIKRLARDTRLYLMVGNHDKAGNGRSDIHSLMIHEGQGPNVKVIDRPSYFQDIPGTVLIPHMDSAEDFLAACEAHKHLPTVVCHQTFAGSQYENGFYAKDGINPDLVPQETILSGHIHRPQRNGKVWYVGAPRWRTSADADTERRLWLMTQGPGVMVVKAQYDTGEVCRRIVHTIEEEDLPLDLDAYDLEKDDVTVTLTGSAEWLAIQVPKRERQGFRVRTIKTGVAAAPRIRESEGVSTAFKRFVTGYQPKHKTPIPVLEKLAAERIAHG
jgi:hypothetical protein